jgi:hypothetical protein
MSRNTSGPNYSEVRTTRGTELPPYEPNELSTVSIPVIIDGNATEHERDCAQRLQNFLVDIDKKVPFVKYAAGTGCCIMIGGGIIHAVGVGAALKAAKIALYTIGSICCACAAGGGSGRELNCCALAATVPSVTGLQAAEAATNLASIVDVTTIRGAAIGSRNGEANADVITREIQNRSVQESDSAEVLTNVAGMRVDLSGRGLPVRQEKMQRDEEISSSKKTDGPSTSIKANTEESKKDDGQTAYLPKKLQDLLDEVDKALAKDVKGNGR